MAKGIYIGVNTDIPIYETTVLSSVNITSSNIEEYFKIETSGTYGFEWGDSYNGLVSNNDGVNSSTASTTLTSLVDADFKCNYGVSSESSYDKFTLVVAGTTVANAISGTNSGNYSTTLSVGDTIQLTYSKDGSQASGNDAGWLYNMVLSNVETTVITGYENKDVAHKVKKMYVGVQQFEPRELPSGYTHVEYIESSGTQCIDTGFKADNNTRVLLDAQLISGSSNAFLFGARTATTSNNYSLSWITASNGFRSDYNSNNTSVITAEYDKRYVFDKNKETTVINGISSSYTNAQFTCDYNLYLFCINSKGTLSLHSSMKFYSCKIYNNDILIRDYVPCVNQTGVGGLYDLVNMKFYGNAGTGTFAVSASSVARKVKKGYIGIGGVARPFMSGGELAYYGTITPLTPARYELAATSVVNYALFGGGSHTSSSYSSSVESYDESLTMKKLGELNSSRGRLAATTVGNYALFGGGYNASSKSNVDFYDTSLTKGTATDLSETRYQLAATTVGDYALFGGGTGSSATRTVDAYNSSLQRTTPTTLAKARKQLAATTVGNYALFGGGYRTAADSAVDAYDSSLTRTIATELSQARYDLAATTVGDYALFGGGYYGAMCNKVDAYDKSLTRTTPIALSQVRAYLSATTVGNYALFGGGGDQSGYHATVDVYDEALTKITMPNLNEARGCLASTTVGNYALFGGGQSYDGGTYSSKSTVDAFVVA